MDRQRRRVLTARLRAIAAAKPCEDFATTLAGPASRALRSPSCKSAHRASLYDRAAKRGRERARPHDGID